MTIDRPLIFSGEMVLRTLDGSKHCTRRKIRPDESMWQSCPYGAPGDRLWVREVFSRNELHPNDFIYRADSGSEQVKNAVWTSPIFMPKKASRIWLRILAIKHEPLQAIDAAGAIAEGVLIFQQGSRTTYRGNSHLPERDDPIEAFRDLWDSLAKPNISWDKDPRVWVISFEKTN